MRIIILPDGGEWVAVPKVATREMFDSLRTEHGLDTCGQEYEFAFAMWQRQWAVSVAAAPPCKVVELPSRRLTCADDQVEMGWNDCLDEIARRAK